MALSYTNYTDARGSNFSHIGRDQIVHQTIHITVTDLVSLGDRIQYSDRKRDNDADNISIPPRNYSDKVVVTRVQDKRQRISHSDNTLRWSRSIAENLSEKEDGTCSLVDTATTLIVKIGQLLTDRRDVGHDYRTLELELESLRQTLTLTNLAIQAYIRTPLGRNLANSIMPHVEQIYAVMQQLFDKIDGYREGLSFTCIRSLWRRVWWGGREEDGLTSLRTKFHTGQISLGEILMALNS